MRFSLVVNKGRKPKFDLHIKISDLNNVPLVSGVSIIKWYLPHSIHGEHRGRTQKCAIVNHRVEYNYSKVVPVRIGIDRNNNLSECPIEFEVTQEFSAGGLAGAAGRDEKIVLGLVRLNLSEYVEESEGILRDGVTGNAAKETLASPIQKPATHHRKRSSLSTTASPGTEASPRSSRDEERPASDVQDGVVRRYLMQDSKINSTLRISILMVQVDGDRTYVAPPPKSAPMFGGIAGFMAGDAFEPVDVGATTPGHPPSSFSGKSRDIFEVQDVYRRALAASWASQPGELPADQCIENIFGGGEGFAPPPTSHTRGHSRHHTMIANHARAGGAGVREKSNSPRRHFLRHDSHMGGGGSGYASEDDENADTMGTLRPRDVTRLRRHLRDQSVASDRSAATIILERDPERESSRAIGLAGPGLREPFPSFHQQQQQQQHPHHLQHRREESKITHDGGLRSRSSSLVSLATATATTLGSDRDREGRSGREGGFKRAREVDELEVRDDLVAWTVPGGQPY
ncbi:N-terminal C2 in EEIG1 and EHBP1 proteins-domain-containing protein [Dichotomopilus funicola]|uniref:N-terminal C2 in EEIG1 and EHBP1 proteins-domain-containing protein n=1 Tax=Dichotomopilus funicola TaxID=1934379 RepID=A0AAN6V795_9PEZI|nr:N-terminal C2 in EEIG1 and EHBP1 proteins-domain-containing protein [Dichotomopilus funicola]